MLDKFDTLAARLKAQAAGKTIIYIANPGNFGDGLIRYGTKQFLADYGIVHQELTLHYSKIKFHLLPYLLRSDRYFFIYGGGGAWCEAYGFGRDICRFIDRFSANYAVLPATYALKDLPQRGLFFRRDETKSIEFNPNSEFCHDMAFYIACRTRQAKATYCDPTHRIGVFMRTDHESKYDPAHVPKDNIDLSLEGDHMSNGDDFLRRVSDYETIYTDRLHVCVAGLITGRKVKLVTGSYFKIKAIYDTSIRPYFDAQVELLPETFTLADLPKATS